MSDNQWFRGKIIEISNEEDGEWLSVCFGKNKIVEQKRDANTIRPITENDADEESDESAYDTDDSLSYSDYGSDEDEKEKQKIKRVKKKLSKHHELVILWVRESGTSMFNGKYVYSTTTETGYPIFEHVDNKYLIIKQNEVELRWEFLNTTKKTPLQVFYYANSYKEFPPSSGWGQTQYGDLPNPILKLDQKK
eukprot:64576_1